MMLSESTGRFQLNIAVIMLVGTIGVILAVLGFQHLGGYIPCKLCLQQREPYYFAIPLAALACLSAWQRWPAFITRGLLTVIGLLMVYSISQAAFHSGVEWGWWQGPTDCGVVDGNVATDTGNLLKQLQTTRPPSCNEAAGRFLGLSFAGWNVLASLGLAIIALKGAFAKAD